jgi:hypothetical protein
MRFSTLLVKNQATAKIGAAIEAEYMRGRRRNEGLVITCSYYLDFVQKLLIGYLA